MLKDDWLIDVESLVDKGAENPVVGVDLQSHSIWLGTFRKGSAVATRVHCD